eukprot:GHVP01050047.1.p1 GENE.GHVP01050047.1~~GHVP01050047.1.p1  ORF type:complete len:536 (+),score=92.19 GHVP01050047.1:39-1646(+)
MYNFFRAVTLLFGTFYCLETPKGSLYGYPTLTEAQSILDDLELNGSVKSIEIGRSFEDRSIKAYILAPGYSNYTSKMLVTSLTHAREAITLTSSLSFLQEAAKAIATKDPVKIFPFVKTQVAVVPIVNPDGWQAIEDTGDKSIRKNRRPTCKSDKPSQDGVDLNRNFDFKFEQNNDPCDQEQYEGSGPFSEPETIALRNFIDSHGNFTTAINLHSYGGLWVHPYNSVERELPSWLSAFYEELKEELHVDTFSTASEALSYTTSGEAADWMYDQRNIVSMSPEIGGEGDGFFPESNETDAAVVTAVSRIFHILRKTDSLLKVKIEDGTISIFNSGLTNFSSGLFIWEKHSRRVLKIRASPVYPEVEVTEIANIEARSIVTLDIQDTINHICAIPSHAGGHLCFCTERPGPEFAPMELVDGSSSVPCAQTIANIPSAFASTLDPWIADINYLDIGNNPVSSTAELVAFLEVVGVMSLLSLAGFLMCYCQPLDASKESPCLRGLRKIGILRPKNESFVILSQDEEVSLDEPGFVFSEA